MQTALLALLVCSHLSMYWLVQTAHTEGKVIGAIRPANLFLQPGQSGLPMHLRPQPACEASVAETQLYGSPEELLRCAHVPHGGQPQALLAVRSEQSTLHSRTGTTLLPRPLRDLARCSIQRCAQLFCHHERCESMCHDNKWSELLWQVLPYLDAKMSC